MSLIMLTETLPRIMKSLGEAEYTCIYEPKALIATALSKTKYSLARGCQACGRDSH